MCLITCSRTSVLTEEQRKESHRRYRIQKLRKQMMIIESNYKLNDSNDRKYCLQLQQLQDNNDQNHTHYLFTKLIYKWTSTTLQRNKQDDLFIIQEQNIVHTDLLRLYKLKFIRNLIKKITSVLHQVYIQPDEIFTMKIIEIRQDDEYDHNYYNLLFRFLPLNFNHAQIIIICLLFLILGYLVGLTRGRSNHMMKTRSGMGHHVDDSTLMTSAVGIEMEGEGELPRKATLFYSSLLIKYLVWWSMLFYIFMYKNILLRYNISLPSFIVTLYVCYHLCDHYVFYFLLLLSL